MYIDYYGIFYGWKNIYFKNGISNFRYCHYNLHHNQRSIVYDQFLIAFLLWLLSFFPMFSMKFDAWIYSECRILALQLGLEHFAVDFVSITLTWVGDLAFLALSFEYSQMLFIFFSFNFDFIFLTFLFLLFILAFFRLFEPDFDERDDPKLFLFWLFTSILLKVIFSWDWTVCCPFWLFSIFYSLYSLWNYFGTKKVFGLFFWLYIWNSFLICSMRLPFILSCSCWKARISFLIEWQSFMATWYQYVTADLNF